MSEVVWKFSNKFAIEVIEIFLLHAGPLLVPRTLFTQNYYPHHWETGIHEEKSRKYETNPSC